MGSTMFITDRYRALGIPYPDPMTMCSGQCEGTGIVPTRREGEWVGLWDAEEAKKPSKDGYHFVICPECHGSGKKVPNGSL